MTERDRYLATILFTDIVGSTERASELGDRRWKGESPGKSERARASPRSPRAR